MNLKTSRRQEMFATVSRFGATHAGAFPPGTVGHDAFAAVGAIAARLSDEATRESRGRTHARHAVAIKTIARRALHASLAAVCRTARAIDVDTPGTAAAFRLPRARRDRAFLAAGTALAAQARETAPAFVAHGLPATFLDDLQRDLDAFAQALHASGAGRAAHVAARALMDADVQAGLDAVRKLDAVVPNVLGHEAGTMATWRSARHVVRRARQAPRHAGAPRPIPLPLVVAPLALPAAGTATADEMQRGK